MILDMPQLAEKSEAALWKQSVDVRQMRDRACRDGKAVAGAPLTRLSNGMSAQFPPASEVAKRPYATTRINAVRLAVLDNGKSWGDPLSASHQTGD